MSQKQRARRSADAQAREKRIRARADAVFRASGGGHRHDARHGLQAKREIGEAAGAPSGHDSASQRRAAP